MGQANSAEGGVSSRLAPAEHSCERAKQLSGDANQPEQGTGTSLLSPFALGSKLKFETSYLEDISAYFYFLVLKEIVLFKEHRLCSNLTFL